MQSDFNNKYGNLSFKISVSNKEIHGLTTLHFHQLLVMEGISVLDRVTRKTPVDS